MNNTLAMTKKAKGPTPIHIQQTVSEAFGAILLHNFNYLSTWEGEARSWINIEGVHQMRVAFRRMRSALRVFRSAIPRPVTSPWADEMRWLANQLGSARDLDVFIAEGLDFLAGKLPLPGQEKLAALAQRHRAQAYENVRLMLDSDRYACFKQDFGAWLENQTWLEGDLQDKHRQRLASNVVSFARKLLDKQERQVQATGDHVNQDSAQEMHQLRIECKKLRYAAEFFNSLFKDMDGFISHLKRLQDLLGVMHDVAVMHHLLDELLAGQSDPELLQYAGGLVGWRTRQYYEIKDSFHDRWKEFIGAKRPWKKDYFYKGVSS